MDRFLSILRQQWRRRQQFLLLKARGKKGPVLWISVFLILIMVLLSLVDYMGGHYDRYLPPAHTGHDEPGVPFRVDPSLRHALLHPFFPEDEESEPFMRLSMESAPNFVFAMAADKAFYAHAMATVATMIRYFPDRQVIFHGLGGLEEKHVAIIEQLKNVEYREFDFSKYPAHIRNTKTYAWKPLIILEMMLEFDGVFWLDTSVRLRPGDLEPLYRKSVSNDLGLLLLSSGHPNMAGIHQNMYEYIPTNFTAQQSTMQLEASAMLLYRTRTFVTGVLKWWILCALVEDCIAPSESFVCNVTIAEDTQVGCHRFDQAAINLLLSNLFHFQWEKYSISEPDMVEIHKEELLGPWRHFQDL